LKGERKKKKTSDGVNGVCRGKRVMMMQVEMAMMMVIMRSDDKI